MDKLCPFAIKNHRIEPYPSGRIKSLALFKVPTPRMDRIHADVIVPAQTSTINDLSAIEFDHFLSRLTAWSPVDHEWVAPKNAV
jgi:hypothetical protein